MILIVKVKKYSIFLSLRKDLLVCMVRTGRTCAYCERNSNRPAAEKREDTLFKLNTMIEIIMQNEEKWKGSLVFWRRSYYKRRLDSRSERGEPLCGRWVPSPFLDEPVPVALLLKMLAVVRRSIVSSYRISSTTKRVFQQAEW